MTTDGEFLRGLATTITTIIAVPGGGHTLANRLEQIAQRLDEAICGICGVPVTDRPLYRDGPFGQVVPWICEPCKVERDGSVDSRIEIVDIIDASNQQPEEGKQ